jgi:hypothetical protein
MSLRTHRHSAWLPLILLFLFIPIIDVVPLFVDLDLTSIVVILFLGCLAFPRCCLARRGNVYHGGPLVGAARIILVAGTKFRQMLMVGPLAGAGGRFDSGHH